MNQALTPSVNQALTPSVNQALTPSDMKPDYDYLPFTQTLADIGNGVIGTVVIAAVICLAVGALLFLVGKFATSSDTMTKVGARFFVAALIAIAFMAGSGKLAQWATTVDLVGDTTGGAALLIAPSILPYL